MAYEFRMPDLGEGVAEGEIVRWLVAVGEEIAEDDLLVEIQTDKATVEVPSPAAGVVSRILAEEGDVVPVGELLVVIGSPMQRRGQVPQPAAPDGRRRRRRVQATPAVRRLAAELGVDLAALAADGPVTEAAVRAAAAGPAGGRREPLRGVRRAIAEHLARSHREVPAVTVVEECDFTHLSLTRGELSYLPFVLHATADALGRHPALERPARPRRDRLPRRRPPRRRDADRGRARGPGRARRCDRRRSTSSRPRSRRSGRRPRRAR